MAYNSSSSNANSKVHTCSTECEQSYAQLKKLYDTQREQLGDASIEIQAYDLALKKVEAQLVTHQKNQLCSFKGLSKLLNSQMSTRDKSRLGYGDQVHNGVLSYENEVFQSVFDSRLSDIKDSSVHDRFANVEGMHAVSPPMIGNYMPSAPDREVDDSIAETLEFVPEPVVVEPKVVSQPKVINDEPIIEEWHSDCDDEEIVVEPKEIKRTEDSSQLWLGFSKDIDFSYLVSKEILMECQQRRNNHKDFQHCLFACFLSQNEPKKIFEALEDESWVDAMQEELLQFKIQKVWILIDLPYGKKAIGTKWVYKNKKDERGVVVRNKARFVAQGHRQEEAIDYDEVFAPVARIEAIRIFLAFASYMGFIVYQMDVKSAFLAWYATLSTFLLRSGYRRGTIDKTLFIKKDKNDIIVSSFDLEAYSDSDYAGANLDRKSTTGGCQFLGRRLISWQCKKQTIVATSTTEAEYVAAANCCGQVLWIQNQMLDYGFNFMNTKIYIDNESTICIVKNPVFHSKTKHIEIRHHFIRDAYEKKLIQVLKIHTDDNVADLLTKAFDVSRFNFLIVNIGMINQ
ncbi:putative ribonuclease H-like domain-containing protein [Tanacetum coccineum]